MTDFDAKIDYYAILGVPVSASERDITRAWHQLAGRYHPDKHQGHDLEDLARDKLIQINEAHRILSDAKLRAAYDEARRQGSFTTGTTGASRPATPGATPASPIRQLLLLVGGIGALFLLMRLGVLRNPRVALVLALVVAAAWFGPRIVRYFRK